MINRPESQRRLPLSWLLPTRAWASVRTHDARNLSLRGPLTLLLAGLALALITTPGPWPGLLTPASLALCGVVSCVAFRLARRGDAGWAMAGLVAVALIAVPLAFGPSPIEHRRVTEFNAWAYQVGARLPAVVSPAPNPNAVAGMLAAALALAAAPALYGQGRRRLLAALVVLLVASALALTASRTGWLAGTAAVSAMAARRKRRWALMVLPLSALAMAALLAMAPRLTCPANVAIRQSLWLETLILLRRQPLLGLGIGRLAQAGVIASSPYGYAPLNTTHNAFLQLWADAGMLGLVAVAWGVVRVGRACLSSLATRRSPSAWAIVGLEGAMVAFAVQGLVETNTILVWQTAGAMHHIVSPLPFALLGLLCGLLRAEQVAGPRARPDGPPQSGSTHAALWEADVVAGAPFLHTDAGSQSDQARQRQQGHEAAQAGAMPGVVRTAPCPNAAADPGPGDVDADPLADVDARPLQADAPPGQP